MWGKEWFHIIEQLPNDFHSETGCLVDVFYNHEIGKIALLYVVPEKINVDTENLKSLLELIHEKWIKNEPCIIFDEIKYKEIAMEWNNYSNTTYSIDCFELCIRKKV
jgi:hypothetical protein